MSYVIHSIRLPPGASKVYSVGHKGSVTTSQRIHGYISLMGTLKFIYFLNNNNNNNNNNNKSTN